MGADAHGLLVGGEGGHPRANVTVAFTDWFLPSIPRRFCLPAHRRVTHPAPDPPPPAPAIDGVCLLSVCQPAYCGDGADNRVCNGAGKRFTSLLFWFWQACASFMHSPREVRREAPPLPGFYTCVGRPCTGIGGFHTDLAGGRGVVTLTDHVRQGSFAPTAG